MLRPLLVLVLIFASAHALAQNNRAVAAVPGACQDAEATAREEAAQTGAVHAKATAARSKYAKPASATAGGGGDEESAPRLRGSRWHSFLPGMFR